MSGRVGRASALVVILGLAAMSLMFLVFLTEEASNPMELILGIAGAGGIGWLLFRGPVGKALASMLEGETGGDQQVAMRVAELEDRLHELTLEAGRIAELEERLDFTERLLAAQPESQPRGGAH